MRVQVAVLTCDGCGVETEPARTLSAATALARTLSWRVTSREDLCAECRPGEDPPVPAGLAARLRTIGSAAICWCGLPVQHDWAGKADGRPHPGTDGTEPVGFLLPIIERETRDAFLRISQETSR